MDFGRQQSEETSELRDWLQSRSNCRIVGRDEFCRLLVSNKRLRRADQPALKLFGLVDVESGMHFLIERRNAFSMNL